MDPGTKEPRSQTVSLQTKFVLIIPETVDPILTIWLVDARKPRFPRRFCSVPSNSHFAFGYRGRLLSSIELLKTFREEEFRSWLDSEVGGIEISGGGGFL